MVPTPAVTGGMYLSDGAPPGTARLVVNMREGEVRPGSQYLSAAGQIGGIGRWYANGLYHYRTHGGVYFTIGVGTLAALPATPVIAIMHGLRQHNLGLMPWAPNETQRRIPVTWTVLENHVLAAGPFEGRIAHVQFDGGAFDTASALTAINRETVPFAQDDDGPWLTTPPRSAAIFVHQDRLLVITPEGLVYISNLRDPQGWPSNNWFALRNHAGYDKTVCGISVDSGRAVVFQRDQAWEVLGDLSELRGTYVSPSPATNGPVSPASIQVAGGVLYGLGEAGPFAYPGGIIPAFAPLFEPGHDDALELERYRPLAAGLAEAISRFDARRGVIEWAVGVQHDTADDAEDIRSAAEWRRLRLCYRPRDGRAWLEMHPRTDALCVVDDGHDDPMLVRGAASGRLWLEGVGDFDQDWNALSIPPAVRDLAIEARVDLRPFVFEPELGRVRRVWLTMDRRWSSGVRVEALPDARSRESVGIVTAQGEDRAGNLFSSDGSTNGFTFGSTVLETDQTRQVARGLPPMAAGRRVYLGLRTPDGASAGHRFGVRGLHTELAGGGRTG